MTESQGHGRLKRQISLIDMIMVGIGAIIGSGWLFAVSIIASIAGPAGWISWVIGGIVLLVLGLVYAELGAAFPRSGGLVRYPEYSHGPLVGYLMSIGIYYWGGQTRLDRPLIDEDEVEEEVAEAVMAR